MVCELLDIPLDALPTEALEDFVAAHEVAVPQSIIGSGGNIEVVTLKKAQSSKLESKPYAARSSWILKTKLTLNPTP